MKENKKRESLLILAIVFIAFNLRAAITGVGPLISILQEELQLSAGAAGFITTIPLIAFAVFSPVVSGFAVKLGEGRAIAISLLIMALGLAVRSYLGVFGLFAGTALAGIGVAFGNVLLPAIIKGCFPEKEGLLTGLYTAAMSFFASVAAGVSAPIAAELGWRHSMAVWIALAVIGLLIWMPFISMKLGSSEAAVKTKGLYKRPITVWLSLFMGLQCVLFYCFVSWLPTILSARGFDGETAGYLFSLYQIMGIPGAMGAPLMAAKGSQSKTSALWMGIYTVGMVLLFFAQGIVGAGIAVAICGTCSGASISLAMLMIGSRAKDAETAGQLSGLVQSIGYLIAAVGPFVVGMVYDLTQSWNVIMIGLIVLMIPLTVSAVKSGEDKVI